MIKKIKLIKTNRLSEIFQSLDVKFAFCNNKLEQVSVPAKCRDFLGDCVWSKAVGKGASIYGFTYNYKENPFSSKNTLLTLKFPNQESYDNLLKNIDILQALENMYKIKPTKIYKTDQPLTLLIKASPIWQQAQWKISLYTFLLKAYSYPTWDDLESPEKGYAITLGEDKLGKFMSKIKVRSTYIEDSINAAHNNSGFYSIMTHTNHEMYSKLLGGN